MDISEEEKGWALAIKEALTKDDPDLAARITDFEFVHHALIAKEKVGKALKRIHRLEAFRDDHNVIASNEITAEAAFEVIQQFDKTSPGVFLSFGKLEEDSGNKDQAGTYFSSWGYSTFYPKNYTQPEEWKKCFATFYYFLDACQPDFEAIRKGVVMVCEMEGLGWKNFSLEMEKHAAHLYQDAYPLRMQHIILMHPPVVFKAMYALFRPFLSQKVKDAIQMNGHLEQVQQQYPKALLGTTHGGTQTVADMEQEMLKGLKLRYANMKSFKL